MKRAFSLHLLVFYFFLICLGISCFQRDIKMLMGNNKISILLPEDSLINLSPESSLYHIKVLSLLDWEITEKPDWVSFDTLKFKGENSQLVLHFSVLENKSSYSRKGMVTFKNTAQNTAQIEISQLAKNSEDSADFIFRVGVVGMPDTVDYTGNSYEILVTSAKDWSIENALPWVIFEDTVFRGADTEKKIPLTILINQESNTREGTIFFKSENKKIPLLIRQHKPIIEPFVHTLLFDNSTISARASEFPNRNIKLNTENHGRFKLAVDKDANWVQIHYTPSNANDFTINLGEASLSFEDNLLPNKRSTNLYLIKQFPIDTVVATYFLQQEANKNYLEINVNNNTIDAPMREQVYDLEVRSSSDFSIQGNPSWIRIEKGITFNRITPLKVIVQKNTSAARNATFSLISKDASIKLDIAVNQKAAFVQKYPINLDYGIILKANISHSVPEKFEGKNNKYRNFANKITLRLPSDQQAQFWTKNEYGFVVDDRSWKSLVTPLMASVYKGDINKDYPSRVFFPSYDGRATTYKELRIAIAYCEFPPLHPSSLFEDLYYFLYLDLPVPANLTSEDFLIYTIELNEITDWWYNYTPNITWTITPK